MTTISGRKRKSENMEPPFICEDLIMEILSWLPVKSLIRFKCVSNSFQSLISDPMFVKMHLKKSSKNVNFLMSSKDPTPNHSWIFSSPLSSLLNNLSSSPSLHVNHLSTVFNLNDMYRVVGTCNGLVCLFYRLSHQPQYKFCLWNPATRQTFEYLQCVLSLPPSNKSFINMFGFGYDTTTDNYKVVALVSTLNSEDDSLKSSDAKVCTIGDNGWRTVQDFPADTIVTVQGCGVYLNNSLNWIASSPPINYFRPFKDSYVRCEKLVIVSLDMGSERYTRLSLPQALDGVSTNVLNSIRWNSTDVPRVGLLNDCLSLFLIDSKIGYLSIWQLKEFGNRNSWIQLFHINTMQDLDGKIQNYCVFMITYHPQIQTIFYEGIDNLVKYDQLSFNILSKDYVQSLASVWIRRSTFHQHTFQGLNSKFSVCFDPNT